MKNISIAAYGAIPVNEHWDKSLIQLGVEAILDTIQKTSLEPEALYVGNMLGQSLNHQDSLATLIAEASGLEVDSLDVNSGENSGLMALQLATMAIRAGNYKNVLVLGVEKTSDRVQSQIISTHASGLNQDYETSLGATQVSQSALLMQRYLYETKKEQNAFEAIPMNGHLNAVSNPYAMYRKPIRAGLYAKLGSVSTPLNMFDVAPYADGAACVFLTSESVDTPVFLSSISQANDKFSLSERKDFLKLSAVEKSASNALTKVDMELSDIDFFELDDYTSIQLLLSIEAVGLAENKKGIEFLEEGSLSLSNVPVCTLGGSKARGYPIAASAIYQVIEAIMQIQGKAGKSQIENAKNAMIQSVAGVGASAITCILSKETEA